MEEIITEIFWFSYHSFLIKRYSLNTEQIHRGRCYKDEFIIIIVESVCDYLIITMDFYNETNVLAGDSGYFSQSRTLR